MTEPESPQQEPIIRHMEPGTYYWCACGHSKTQPFCDGAHSGTGIMPQEVTLEHSGEVAWCACKKSGSKPFCDGTHQSL